MSSGATEAQEETTVTIYTEEVKGQEQHQQARGNNYRPRGGSRQKQNDQPRGERQQPQYRRKDQAGAAQENPKTSEKIEGAEGEEVEVKQTERREPRNKQPLYRPKTAGNTENTEDQESQPTQERQKSRYRLKGTQEAVEEDQQETKREAGRSKSRPRQAQQTMVYKRKDEIAKEEEEAKKEGAEKPSNQGKAQGAGKKRRNEKYQDDQEPPKFNSALEEYRAGYWRRPKKEKVFVTLETVIPPLPKNPLEFPDESQYHKQQAEFDEKMDAITLKTKDLAERFNERLQQLKSLSRPNRNPVEGEAESALPPSASKELKLLFETMKINSDERKRIYAIVEDLNKEVTDAENRKAKAEKKVHKTYNKLDMLEKGVKEIERKLQITSTDGKQEKEMIKEMQFIRDSRPYLEEIAGLNQIIFQKKKEKYEISQPIGPLKEEAKELQTKIDSFKKTQEVAKESKETIQKALDKINQERNTLRGQNEDLWQQKLKLREDFYKKLLAYERQQIEIRDIEWMTGIKERVIQREEEKKQWEEEKARRQEERKQRQEELQKREEERRQQELEWRKEEEEKQKKWEESQLQRLDAHPFVHEIELCDYLINYCQKQDQHLNGRLTENKSLSETAAKVAARKAAMEQERRELEEARNKAIEEKLKKGMIARAEKVNEKQVFKAAAPNVKQEPAKPKALPVYEEDDSLNLDMGIIQRFGRLNITAPIVAGDLPKAMKELKELKLAFVQKGDEQREAAKANFLKQVRRQRGEPQPAEPKKLDAAEEGENEESKADSGVERAPEDKLRLVEKIMAMKLKQGGRGRQTRYHEDDDFGEEGLDIDTYESRYANDQYQSEEDEEVPLKGGRPPVEEVRGGDRRGGRGGRGGRGDRGGDRRGGNNYGRGGYRGDRGNGGYEERGARSKSRGAPRQKYPPRDQEEIEDEGEQLEQQKPQQQKPKQNFKEVFGQDTEWPQIE